ncbi:hypothetical protein ABW21_db0206805 [Orbilia brochopaga]|nr:hypothetical protein ABW21_db0206805 [Drechslerella brochopaga]
MPRVHLKRAYQASDMCEGCMCIPYMSFIYLVHLTKRLTSYNTYLEYEGGGHHRIQIFAPMGSRQRPRHAGYVSYMDIEILRARISIFFETRVPFQHMRDLKYNIEMIMGTFRIR